MSNGKLVKKIGVLMDKKKMSVAAYRELMLEATVASLTKQDAMDDKLKTVCVIVDVHDKAIDSLKKRDNLNNMLTTAVGAIAAFVGFKN